MPISNNFKIAQLLPTVAGFARRMPEKFFPILHKAFSNKFPSKVIGYLLIGERFSQLAPTLRQLTWSLRVARAQLKHNPESLQRIIPQVLGHLKTAHSIAERISAMLESSSACLHPAAPSDFDLAEIVRNMVEEFSKDAKFRRIDIEVDLSEELPVFMDINRLKDTLITIFLNTSEAMGETMRSGFISASWHRLTIRGTRLMGKGKPFNLLTFSNNGGRKIDSLALDFSRYLIEEAGGNLETRQQGTEIILLLPARQK